MLEPFEWKRLTARVPRTRTNLRGPAAEADLLAVELRIGRALPRGFRNFLRAHDGGFLGEARVLGTVELRCQWPVDLPQGLLPFHPVGNGGFECLDLSRKLQSSWQEAPVVWWQPGRGAAQTYVDFTDWLLDEMQEMVGA